MRAFKHLNKQPVKFYFDAYLCDLRGVPSDVGQVCILWEKASNTKDPVVSQSVETQTTGSDERTAMIDETLRLPATLYRSKRSDAATYDSKLTHIKVMDVSSGPYAPPTTLAQADLDLADYANLSVSASTKSIKLSMPRTTMRRRDPTGDDMMMIQMTLQSTTVEEHGGTPSRGALRELRGASASSPYPSALAPAAAAAPASATLGSGASDGGFSSSLASDAPTHEGAPPTPQHQPHRGGSSSSSSSSAAALRSSSSGIGGSKGSSRAEASRVAELSQLMAGAAADARQAESRLATLQFRLRREVVEDSDAALAGARGLKRGEEQAKAYDALVVHLIDQVRRIASDDGGFSRGGGGVAPLEAEVLQLRRDLADSKVEVARLSNERDELAHVAKRLNKQLATVARRQSSTM